jgi:hypothetical protein
MALPTVDFPTPAGPITISLISFMVPVCAGSDSPGSRAGKRFVSVRSQIDNGHPKDGGYRVKLKVAALLGS